MVYKSIYSDTYYTSSASTLYYRIELDGAVIYSGKAVRMPNADEIKININKICQNYLSNDIEDILDYELDSSMDNDAIKVFDLINNATNEILERYTFLFDWNYIELWTGQLQNRWYESGSAEEEIIIITPSTIAVTYTGGLVTVNVQYVNGNQQLTATTTGGAVVCGMTWNGDMATVTIGVPENQTLSGKTYTVNFIGDETSNSLTITQEAQREVVTVSVSPSSLTVPASGSSYYITITSNGNWTITAPSWITLSTSTGSGNATIGITVGNNGTGNQRTGNIVVATVDRTATVSVTQNTAASVSDYLTFEILSNGVINFKNKGTEAKTLYYTKNNGLSWNEITSTTGGSQIAVTAGENVKFRGNNTWLGRTTFSGTTARFNLYGNIMSTLYNNDFADKTVFPSVESYDHQFSYLFQNCTTLINASQLILPATTLAPSCYLSMFEGCTSLTTAPELPATTLASHCYFTMFYKCTSLTGVPSNYLPATTLASHCYEDMFWGCTSLTTAPTLPATTLTENCYYAMFHNCTSLTTAPTLPATTLANNCYNQMFQGCSGLTSAPSILPATTLAERCYLQMFMNCIRLTTAPELPATTLASECYQNMFRGCSSLTNVPNLPATTLADNCYMSMFQDCTSLTTAPALPATTLATQCYNSMFNGCTSLTTAPALSATTLATQCYGYMFYDCISLTTAPVLPATTLVEKCYIQMFMYCSNLNYIKCLATDISASDCTYFWTYGVSATGTFVKDANMSDWTTGVSGIPTNWTVQNA